MAYSSGSEEQKGAQYFIGLSCTILSIFFLSFRSILVKIAYDENVLVMDLFYLRFFFALPMLITFAYFKKGEDLFLGFRDKFVLIGSIFAGLFGYYLATLFDFFSLQLINAGVSRVILYLFPIFVLLINSIYSRSVPDIKTVALFLIAFFGVLMILGGFDINIINIDKRGVVFALLATFSYSFYILINGEVTKKVGSVLFTCYAVFFSFLFINIHFWLFNDYSNVANISDKGWLVIVCMSFFCTFLPLLLISEAISRLGLLQFSIMNNLGPIFAVIISYVFLGETMILQQLVGVALVVLILFISSKK